MSVKKGAVSNILGEKQPPSSCHYPCRRQSASAHKHRRVVFRRTGCLEKFQRLKGLRRFTHSFACSVESIMTAFAFNSTCGRQYQRCQFSFMYCTAVHDIAHHSPFLQCADRSGTVARLFTSICYGQLHVNLNIPVAALSLGLLGV